MVAKEDTYLMKMNFGVTFSALNVLFGVKNSNIKNS